MIGGNIGDSVGCRAALLTETVENLFEFRLGFADQIWHVRTSCRVSDRDLITVFCQSAHTERLGNEGVEGSRFAVNGQYIDLELGIQCSRFLRRELAEIGNTYILRIHAAAATIADADEDVFIHGNVFRIHRCPYNRTSRL